MAATEVHKRFGRVTALAGVNLLVAPGELVGITGPSGSGKSTLLSLVGGLDRPDSGRVLIDDEAVWEGPHTTRARRDLVGFVFQNHLLLPNLTAQANVEVPLLGAGVGRHERQRRAALLLAEVGAAHRAEHLPSELSGGERQRVAVARALANEPRLLLADEPTGALDSAAAQRVLDLLVGRISAERNMTLIIVSHDPEVAARADRIIHMVDGRVTTV